MGSGASGRDQVQTGRNLDPWTDSLFCGLVSSDRDLVPVVAPSKARPSLRRCVHRLNLVNLGHRCLSMRCCTTVYADLSLRSKSEQVCSRNVYSGHYNTDTVFGVSNRVKISVGVRSSRIAHGPWSSWSSTRRRSTRVYRDKSMLFGKYCGRVLLVLSSESRRHGTTGVAEVHLRPDSSSDVEMAAIPLP